MKPKNQPFPPEKIEAIGRMYAAGETLRTIADTVGCSMGGASAIARKRLGLPRRNIDQGLVPWRAIFAAYQSGKSCKAIAEELRAGGVQISQDTVSKRLRRKGVKMRPAVRRMDVAQVAAVVRLTRQGLTHRQIGKILGLTRNQVDHRRRHALPPSRSSKPIDIDLAEVAKMRADGMLWREIAKRIGCSRACVTRRFFGLDRGGRPIALAHERAVGA